MPERTEKLKDMKCVPNEQINTFTREKVTLRQASCEEDTQPISLRYPLCVVVVDTGKEEEPMMYTMEA